ncbi:hypothetical protein Tco_0511184, partial [Tanacetum coccineum]
TLFAQWHNPILSMAPTSNELLQPWVIRSMEYFGSHDVEHEQVLIDHEIPVGENTVAALERQSEPDVSVERQSEPDVALEPQFEAGVALNRQSEPNVPMFTREELVAEHHAIKERVQIIENLANADPSIYKNESVSEDSVAKHKEFVHKENESANGKMAESAFSCVLIGEVSSAKSVSNEFVLQQLQSCDGKLPESSLSDVLNGEFSCDINRPNEHMSEKFVENELESGDGKLHESEIKNVLISEASRDKFVPSYCNGQSSKLYYRPEQDIHLDELLSENGDQLLNTTDVVEGEKYENDAHVDQSPVEQKCQDLALYLNEVNVGNENEPPSAVKIVGQLLRKTYKGKALVEPYTIQPPTTASVHLGKAIRKRKKKAAKRLQSRKAQILFDDDGDDDQDVMFISLEDWNTQSNKTCKRKDTIPLSEIAKSEFPLVEYCEVITIGDETTYLLAWGNYDKEVDWSGVITLFDSMGVSVEETREWSSDMRIAFKTSMPHYFRDWGILEAKCIDTETYNIKFDVGKDIPLQGEAYRDCGVWLLYYCYNLKLANEGTVTHIHTDTDGRFEMLYVGFGFAIRSSLRYMRPLIIIDGAHLKGNYLGTNLLAVRMDGNNQILPFATGVSQGKKHHGIFWKACKAYTMQAFEKAISELRAYRPKEASAEVYDRMLKSAKWTVKGIDHLQLYQVCNTKEVHQATTKRRQEHLSQEARLDEERLRNGRIYMDWIDYEATEAPLDVGSPSFKGTKESSYGFLGYKNDV